MTITPMEMYWLTRLDGINEFFIGVGLVSLLGGSLFAGLWKAGYPGYDNREGYWPFAIPVVGLALTLASLFIPTTKEAAAILVVPAIVNNQKVQEMPNKLLGLAEEWLEELRPVEKKK